ncbi:uncharacterized protein BcabD6B2_38360 [Babesia caballi]|uniref:Uncharacterized protein n=1 Tax=Babesia caballi TaxID=5871 RepID=A0AAV4LX31_BABCB|nr:hypothetical protein, conserved [Babesia caballi]
MGGLQHFGEDDAEEVEFEGWLHVSPPNSGLMMDGAQKCSSGASGFKACAGCGESAACRKHSSEAGHAMTRGDRRCNSRSCVNIVRRGGSGACRCKRVEVPPADNDEIFYVNNKQHAPKIMVQKPQTVIVRNHSRPPIVVQQPPPNVIVKNDPPQPIFVQNCPPNVVVKNERPGPVFKAPAISMKYPQVYQSGYPPNYAKSCGCPRHQYQ